MYLKKKNFESTNLNDVSVVVFVDQNATLLNAFSTALAWFSLIFESLETERDGQKVRMSSGRTETQRVQQSLSCLRDDGSVF